MKEILRQYLWLTVALSISCIGWCGFILPQNIVGSGFLGLSKLIELLSDGFLPAGMINLIANGIMLAIAIRVVGVSFGFKTIYCITFLSIMVDILGAWITEPLVSDKFMCAIMGSIIVGSSIGMMLSQGGSTGGTEIVAMIVSKYRNIMPGRVMMMCDIVIIASGYTLHHSIQEMIYGYVVMIGISMSADYILTGSKQSIQIMVISKRGRELADVISSKILRGITLIHGEGYYTGENREIIMMLVRRTEMHDVLRIIRAEDPESFVSVASVTGVYGNGFDAYKPPVKIKGLNGTNERLKG
ncbi:MAG: YitT family protein [Bacteroidales bacterium]|nr:YitT family protein [Bacteroidales bacterium]